MGVLVTDNPIVLETGWYPTNETSIKISDYSWTSLTKSGSDGIVYFLEYDYGNKNGNIYKFYTDSFSYVYTPTTITVTAKSRVGAEMSVLAKAKITCTMHYSYTDESNNEIIDVLKELTSDAGSLTINFDDYTDTCLEFLVFNCDYNGERILTEIKDIPFGTKKDMAKLALNANNIVASIQETKLTFDTNGLTIKNGGFKIIGSDGLNPVFYVNEKGDLSFTGELTTSSGSLGGWKINEYGLYIEESLTQSEIDGGLIPNKLVGLYGGGNLFYPGDSLQNPIRIWAGQYDDSIIVDDAITNFKNYNFAVTENGSLYAKMADISGKIVATSGYIKNKFLVGDTNNGIVIYGGDTNIQSFIGSALSSSGPLGYGWKLSQDGTAEFNNITARGKIQSSVFEYNKISSVGGSLYIAPTIYTEEESLEISELKINTLDDSGAKSSLIVSWILPYSTIELNNEETEETTLILQNVNGRDWKITDEVKLDGDILIGEKKYELSNIDGYISAIEAIDEKNSKVSITFEVEVLIAQEIIGQKFLPGTILILYGSEERRHGLYLTAAGSNSPYMDVYDDSADNTVKPAVRLGNLAGINDENFPMAAFSGYGLYSSNAYLRGQLMLPGAGITNQETIYYGDENTSSPIRIWAGLNNTEDDISKANFIVTENGYMYAKQGIFEGTVKASNSEFSGTIKAAGIVVEEGGTGLDPAPKEDHFFVAYTDNPTNFNDYVLDIGAHGLSIWEGALRAYSDYASGLKESTSINPIYGYSNSEEYKYLNPLPYFSLADDGNGEELNSRIVAHKGHFLTVKLENANYVANSVIIDDGIWFVNNTYNNIDNIEYTSFYKRNKINNGIFLKNNLLTIDYIKGINLNTTGTIYIGAKDTDFVEKEEKLFIRGQVNIVNDISDNLISLNGQIIKEAFAADKTTSIGFDIVVS